MYRRRCRTSIPHPFLRHSPRVRNKLYSALTAIPFCVTLKCYCSYKLCSGSLRSPSKPHFAWCAVHFQLALALSTNSSQSVVVWSSTARLGLMLERIRRRTVVVFAAAYCLLQSSNDVIKMTLILIAVRIDVVWCLWIEGKTVKSAIENLNQSSRKKTEEFSKGASRMEFKILPGITWRMNFQKKFHGRTMENFQKDF